MKTELDNRILEAMEVYGGSFVKALAHLARQADSTNFQKIKNTWSDYWLKYEQMVNVMPK